MRLFLISSLAFLISHCSFLICSAQEAQGYDEFFLQAICEREKGTMMLPSTCFSIASG